MLKFRKFDKAVTTTPPLQGLVGGALAKADRLQSVHTQADCLLNNDANVVCRVGLSSAAATAFQVVSEDPDSPSQIYPLKSVSRVVHRTPPVALLPGHFLRVSCLVVPSGPSQVAVIGAGWETDTVEGRINIAVDFVGTPGTDSRAYTFQLPSSPEEWGAEDTSPAAGWVGLRRVERDLMTPGGVTTDKETLRLWSEGVTAEITIKFLGGVRAVDVCVQQVPYQYARRLETDYTFTSTLTTDGGGAPILTYPSPFPVEERGALNPVFGMKLLERVTDRQQHALGPVLMSWGAWDETSDVTDTEVPSLTTSSTTFVDMPHSGVSSWAATNPGWSLSSAPHQAKSSNGLRETRGQNGSVPVTLWARCSRTGVLDATLRFQTEHYSLCDIVVTSSTDGWVSANAYLRAGAHPQDPSTLQVFGKVGVDTSTLRLSGLFIQYTDL